MNDSDDAQRQGTPRDIGRLGEEGLAFFSTMNASISHELKNIMATISETAGLLTDLARMGEKDGNLRPETVRRYSESIVEDTLRGFATINHMNAFAHSADEFIKEVHLNDVVELMVNLSRCLKFARKVNFQRPEVAPTKMFTSPFFLANILFYGLVFAFESVAPEDEIRVSVRHVGEAVEIVFAGLDRTADRVFPTDQVKTVAEAIDVQVSLQPSDGELRFRLPRKTPTPA